MPKGRHNPELEFEAIRRTAVTAMFSDDKLMQQLVLKGGNALRLAYGIGSRASLDLDFSIEGDFEDLADARTRILSSLRQRFDSAGYFLFDEEFEEVPEIRDDGQPSKGYAVRFKLLSKDRLKALQGNLRKMQVQAQTVGPQQQREFKIDISKGEFCGDKRERQLDDYSIYVYSPTMIAIEKIRAVCQQMPEYQLRKKKTARARDFYDLRALVETLGVSLQASESLDLFGKIFGAKEVPLGLIRRIGEYREFHRAEWPYVETSIEGEVEPFDFYFDFVVEQTLKLEALWVK